jgi:hypothetical protein
MLTRSGIFGSECYHCEIAQSVGGVFMFGAVNCLVNLDNFFGDSDSFFKPPLLKEISS